MINRLVDSPPPQCTEPSEPLNLGFYSLTPRILRQMRSRPFYEFPFFVWVIATVGRPPLSLPVPF